MNKRVLTYALLGLLFLSFGIVLFSDAARKSITDSDAYNAIVDAEANFVELYASIAALTVGSGSAVSSNDTTPGYLYGTDGTDGKFRVSGSFSLAEGDNGGDEYMTLSASGSSIEYVYVDSTKITPTANYITFASDDAQGLEINDSGTTLTFTNKNATSSQKGVCSFSDTDFFTVTDGDITATGSAIQYVYVDSTKLTPTANYITFASDDAQGITLSGADTTITISAENASDSNKGVASFSDTTAFTVTSGDVDFNGPVAFGLTNLITNSGFGVWSQSTLANVGSQITLTDVTNGVCSTANTQGIEVDDIFTFDAGDMSGETYQVTAVTTNTSFTINDTSVSDAGAPGTGYQQTPGEIAADTQCADHMTKTSTLDTWRWDDHAYVSGLYGIKATKGADGAEYVELAGNRDDKKWWYDQFQGRTVTLGARVYSTTATDNVKLQINDSDGTSSSSFAGADAKEWLTVTRTCGSSITSFNPRVLLDGDTSDVAYVSEVMLAFTDHLPEGSYQPIPNEVVKLDLPIRSDALHETTGLSTTAKTAINLEVDTSGGLPKNVAGFWMVMGARDSGSAAGNGQIIFYESGSAGRKTAYLTVYGRTNDTWESFNGFIPCGTTGDFGYELSATGAGTFDFTEVHYTAIVLR